MLNSLQLLRALAAYSVVLYHASEATRFATKLPIPNLECLSAGVDLFFVISGFVMVYTTGPETTPRQFFGRRIARIVPLYWTTTALACLGALIVPYAFSSTNLSLPSILSSFAFLPYPNAEGRLFPVHGVGWTLNYEMLFYVLFALSLLLPARLRFAGVLLLLTTVWALSNIVGAGVYARFYGEPIIFEFAVGCLLAKILFLEPVARFIRRTPMWPFAVMALIAFVAINSWAPMTVTSLFRFGAPAALLAFAGLGHDLYRSEVHESVATQLGDASYSAYLLHTLILTALGLVLVRIMSPGYAFAAVLAVALMAATMIASRISLIWFERPTNRLFRRLILGPSPGWTARRLVTAVRE
jgi:exopolysaccharide production protein ExoZ